MAVSSSQGTAVRIKCHGSWSLSFSLRVGATVKIQLSGQLYENLCDNQNVCDNAPGQFGRPDVVDRTRNCYNSYMGTTVIIKMSVTMPLANSVNRIWSIELAKDIVTNIYFSQ